MRLEKNRLKRQKFMACLRAFIHKMNLVQTSTTAPAFRTSLAGDSPLMPLSPSANLKPVRNGRGPRHCETQTLPPFLKEVARR